MASPGFKPEPNATIRVLRPAKFVDPDEVLFRQNTKNFTDQTGIPVRVDFVSWEDMRPQAAVTANTGAGPDIIVGFGSDPQIYADKLIPMNDLADYLGAKYGGWHELALIYSRRWGTKEWLAIPMGGSGGASGLSRVVAEGGRLRRASPTTTPASWPCARSSTRSAIPPGFALGHAVGDGNGFADLAAMVARRRPDRRGRARSRSIRKRPSPR